MKLHSSYQLFTSIIHQLIRRLIYNHNINSTLIISCVLLLSLLSSISCSPNSIELDSNTGGYKGIVVSIDENVDVNAFGQNNFLDHLKSVIKRTSLFWYEATGTYYNQVTVLIPAKWNDIREQVDGFAWYTDADIRIVKDPPSATSTKPNNGLSESLTLQYGGCGVHGLPIQLLQKVIIDSSTTSTSSPDLSLNETAKILINQWALYRYGVFNEFGFPGDKLYPAYYGIPGSNQDKNIQVTSCSDPPNFIIEIKNIHGSNCRLTINNQTGIPEDENCLPLIKWNNQTDIKSSLMYQPKIPSVKSFCGESKFADNEQQQGHKHLHNYSAPNKQNLLCDEQDVWSVIKSHKDFQSLKISTKQQIEDVNFIFARQKEKPKILISIETGFDKDNFYLMMDSFARFSGHFAQNFDIAVTFFNETQVKTKLSWGNKFNVAWEKINKVGKINLEVPIQDAINKFSNVNEGGTLVLVISENFAFENKTNLIEDLKRRKIKVKMIINPYIGPISSPSFSLESAKLLSEIITSTGGSISYIKFDSNQGDYSDLAFIQQLLDAMESVSQEFDPNQSTQLIHSEIVPTQRQKMAITFVTDKSLDNFKALLISKEEGDANPVLEKQGIGPIDFARDSFRYKYHTKFVSYQSSGIDGVWNVKDSSPDSTTRSSLLYVRSKATSDSINAKCWFSHKDNQNGIAELNSHKPLFVYVQINRGTTSFIENAKVELNFYDEHGKSDLNINLIDDGLSYPDITSGDGIYSQVVPEIKSLDRNQGHYYSVKGIVSDANGQINQVDDIGSTSLPTNHQTKYCCGSKTKGTRLSRSISPSTFSRTIDCGSIFIYKKDIYTIAPAPIRSLRVAEVDLESRKVNISWTGNNYEKYTIRLFHEDDRANIKSGFDNRGIEIFSLSSNSMKTGENHHSFEIPFNEEGNYLVALKVSNGDQSQVSNIATFYMTSKYNPDDFTTALPSDHPSISIKGGNGKLKIGGLDLWVLILICVIASLLLISIIIMIICLVGKRRRKNKTIPDDDSDSRDIKPPTETTKSTVNSISTAAINHKNTSLSNGLEPNGETYIRRNTNLDTNSSSNFISANHIRQTNVKLKPDVNQINVSTINGNGNIGNGYGNGNLNHHITSHDLNDYHHHLYEHQDSHSSKHGSVSYHGSQPSLQGLNPGSFLVKQSWDAKDLLNHWGRVQEAKARQKPPPVMRIEDLERISSNGSQNTPLYSSDEETATYSRPEDLRYEDIRQFTPTNYGNVQGNPNDAWQPAWRNTNTGHGVNGQRSNTPSDIVPAYSSVNKAQRAVSQV